MGFALREKPCHQLIHATAEMSELLETIFLDSGITKHKGTSIILPPQGCI